MTRCYASCLSSTIVSSHRPVSPIGGGAWCRLAAGFRVLQRRARRHVDVVGLDRVTGVAADVHERAAVAVAQADRTAVGCEMPVAQGPRHDAAGTRGQVENSAQKSAIVHEVL